ncbi:MAG: PhoX family phosphatase [Euzebyales bacterium]|nr:PhoX family phosphatase [Euzebyales bacterium]
MSHDRDRGDVATLTHPSAGRRALPLVGDTATGNFDTCKYRCGMQCFHDAPNRSHNPVFEDVVRSTLSRRGLLKGGIALAGLVVLGPAGALATVRPASAAVAGDGMTLGFQPVAPSMADRLVVPVGYASDVLIRWGDPVVAGAPAFDFASQTSRAQGRQFGYNCDYVAYLPLGQRRASSRNGLLVVNHEYANPELMFAGYDREDPDPRHVRIMMAAMGLSVLRIRRGTDGTRTTFFRHLRDSRYNRRITVNTPMRLRGPAAGSRLLRTTADPGGSRVIGTLNNCSGGKTPWGTVLSGEENFHHYFANADALTTGDPRKAIHRRYGITGGATIKGFEQVDDRFDIATEPNEAFRFGWVVEVDPYDPESVPVKRTALGRLKHEGATISLAADGRVVAYMGDDERFEYVYKFVSAEAYRAGDRPHNLGLLDKGTLFVGRFVDEDPGDRGFDGVGRWLPLVFGRGPLTPANGFSSQADVLVNARGAADLLGATKMDRPEDVERNPVTGRVYVALTNNSRRGADGFPAADEPNPRAPNTDGHVIEIDEARGDAAAGAFRWRILLLCGDPEAGGVTRFAGYPEDLVSPIACPDNLAFDAAGNLWIATNGQPSAIGSNDALHVVPVAGSERGHVQQFLSVPRGAEACGPEFTPDNRSLFCAVQHPGEGGTVSRPLSTWPDRDGGPPRPSVVSIWRAEGRDQTIGR